MRHRRIALVTLVIGLAATFLAARPNRGSHATGPVLAIGNRDLMSGAVSAEYLRSLLHQAEFRPVSQSTVLHGHHGSEVARVDLALAQHRVVRSLGRDQAVILARTHSDRAFEAFGLVPGDNYLWVDRQGSVENPWRAIMISGDGQSRTLLSFKYTPFSAHEGPDGPAQHAQRYCNGADGCYFHGHDGMSGHLGDETNRVGGYPAGFVPKVAAECIWMACDAGCCRIEPPPGGGCQTVSYNVSEAAVRYGVEMAPDQQHSRGGPHRQHVGRRPGRPGHPRRRSSSQVNLTAGFQTRAPGWRSPGLRRPGSSRAAFHLVQLDLRGAGSGARSQAAISAAVNALAPNRAP